MSAYPYHLSRRALLRAVVAGAMTGPVLSGCASADSRARHPALASPLDAVVVLALDVRDAGETGQRAVLGLLDRVDDADRDGTMVGFGASLFDRVGVPGARPAALPVMPAFVGDVLDDRRTHGDVLLHVEGSDEKQAAERVTQVLKGVPGLTVRWRVSGRRGENRVEDGRPLVRNPFGFTEGHGNAPAASGEAAAQVLIPRVQGQPAWVAGASVLAVRMVRLARELWDADDAERQDRIVGRRRDGRWLDGRPATADPAFARDPDGAVTPLDSHVRQVNPRTAGMPEPRMLRRGWGYDAGPTVEGQAEAGMLFMAYQADVETGFALAQRRLVGEAMAPYLLTVGGGYFIVPARRPDAGWQSIMRESTKDGP